MPCRHFTGAQLADRGVPRILPVPDPVQSYFLDPRHAYPAALIVAEAILAQLTPDQRREAQNTVHQVYQRIGGDEARAASAFMAGVR
ncbi:hypothetical protein [uncultured Sphingomonas sp.]|uniref:hypothetical protein n=1 Tax=uncultured Sphingomonas sp. TaxID=158754 RepID=UPI0035CA20C5